MSTEPNILPPCPACGSPVVGNRAIGVSCSDIVCGYVTRLRLHLILAGHVAALRMIADGDCDWSWGVAEDALKGKLHGKR